VVSIFQPSFLPATEVKGVMQANEIIRSAEASQPEAVARAAAAFKRDGYVVFERMLSPNEIAVLRREYLAALERKIARFNLGEEPSTAASMQQRPGGYFTTFRPVNGNRDFRRWEMHLPSDRLFLDPRLIAHPLIMKVLEAIDPSYRDCISDTIGSDCAMPGCVHQKPHQDRPTLEIFLNIPLVDLAPDNAPLEVWPGTHQPEGLAEFSKEALMIPQAQVEEIVRTTPGRRITVPAGCYLLRDLRMIHRGTPNITAQPRPMISIAFGRVRPVPYRRVLDGCLAIADGIRQFARRGEPDVSRPTLLNMGNTLGRMTEGSGLTDRYGHRMIPQDLWQQLPEASRHALRYAKLAGATNRRIDEQATLSASLDFIVKFSKRIALLSAIGIAQTWKQYQLKPARRGDGVDRTDVG
jgi:ectoine hydroxylase-related dioxygenase (phytanoyl-CoA dioxygenase family)